jgi:hypothetical protein
MPLHYQKAGVLDSKPWEPIGASEYPQEKGATLRLSIRGRRWFWFYLKAA